jgi:cell division protein FtsB
MKYLLSLLVVLFCLLQYELWFGHGGLTDAIKIKQNIATTQQKNAKLQKRNQVLVADIKNLKQGNQAVAERARNEMGMIKKGETFYQIAK